MEDIQMKDEVEEVTETIETVDTQQENAAPKKRISKTAMWAREHKGFIQVFDPELRAQMVNYRDEFKYAVV